MADRSAIEWTDSTFNPWTGCTKVSPACDHCYAESWSKRAGAKVGKWGAGAPRVRTSRANWQKPIRWNSEPFAGCNECGHRGVPVKLDDGSWHCESCFHVNLSPARRRVFCASLADVFDNEVDPEWRDDLFNLIYRTPTLDWLLLTKRIGNVAQMLSQIRFPADGGLSALDLMPLHNVWLGATICNQAEADRDTPKLLATPARVRFLSIEPMLGPIQLDRRLIERIEGGTQHGLRFIDWIIAGGESGPHARPSHPEWFRALRDQCASAEVPFLFKQWGEWNPSSDHNFREMNCRDTPHARHVDGRLEDRPFEAGWRIDEGSGWVGMCRLGKKRSGRLLDGCEHNGFPEVYP